MLVLALAAPGTLLVAGEGKVPPGTKDLRPASEIRWEPMPGLDGAQQAPLWGDPAKGPHTILYKWKGGLIAPLHTHTNGDRGVVVSGVLTLAVYGETPKNLKAGSYFSMSGGTKHTTSCKEGADCVFYVYRDGPFDAVMIETPGTEKAPKQ
jgi:hypothetical protein